MSAVAREVGELAQLIEKVAGNVVPPGHYGFLDRILLARMRAVGEPTRRGYVDALREGRLADEWRELLPQVTIKESYLFRTPQQFAAVARLLPRLLAPRVATRRLVVWSAGCANGEEAATLALVLAEHPSLVGWEWSVLATDIDREALAAAARGWFGPRAMAQVPPALVERWFTPRNRGFSLHPELLARIRWRELNLVQEPYPLEDDELAVVFLRNVLIYFRPEVQRQVVASVSRRLADDGVLFVGPAESLWPLQPELVAVELEGCFGYTPLRGAAAPAPGRRPAPVRAAATVPSSAERAPPTPRPAPPRSPPVRAIPPAPVSDQAVPAGAKDAAVPAVGPRAAPARGSSARGLPSLGTDAGSTLAQRLGALGSMLAGGDLPAAEHALASLVEGAPTSPAVRALEGLVADLAGRTEAAQRAYRAALFLDPALYQVRLLLADLLRRAGDTAGAQRQYREALRSASGRDGREVTGGSGVLPGRDAVCRRAREALRATGAPGAAPA